MYLTRITNASLNENVLQSLYNNRNKLNELQQQISTGKVIDSPSDNAGATLDIMKSNTSLDKIDTYVKNIEGANSEAEITETALNQLVDIIQRAKELNIQASNATYGTEELQNIAAEIDQLTDNVQDISNTKFGDKYIFGGVNTLVPPYSNPAADEYLYSGTPETGDYQRQVEIAENIVEDINIAGETIFGYRYTDTALLPPAIVEDGLFSHLANLSIELKTDPPNYENIRANIDNLAGDLDNVINQRAKIGGLVNRMEMTKNSHMDNEIIFSKYKSNAEDIDLAKAISDMKFQETALNASLQISSKLIKPSLLNYI